METQNAILDLEKFFEATTLTASVCRTKEKEIEHARAIVRAYHRALFDAHALAKPGDIIEITFPNPAAPVGRFEVAKRSFGIHWAGSIGEREDRPQIVYHVRPVLGPTRRGHMRNYPHTLLVRCAITLITAGTPADKALAGE